MAFPILVSPGVQASLVLPTNFLGFENMWQVIYASGAALVVAGANLWGVHMIREALLVAPVSNVSNYGLLAFIHSKRTATACQGDGDEQA